MSDTPRYQLLQCLGQGGMAQVHLALDRERGEQVALKIVDPEVPAAVVERFRRECEVLARLDHPFIIPLLDGGQLPDGRCFYAMPYVPGCTSLGHWLDHHAGPPARENSTRVLALLAQIASALDHLHELGLYHRDVKPSNILVVPSAGPERWRGAPAAHAGGSHTPGVGRSCIVGPLPDGGASPRGACSPEAGEHALVIDLGLVGMVLSSLTRPGTVLGTTAYLSPELLLGEKARGPSDLYQLGLVLYELVTGQVACQSPSDYLRALDEGRRPFPSPAEHVSDIAPALEEIVLKATASAPGRRYPSARAMVDALASLGTDGWYPDRRGAVEVLTGASAPAQVPPLVGQISGPLRNLVGRLSPRFQERYVLERRMEGRRGGVIQARDVVLKRPVLLSLMEAHARRAPSAERTFERQARALGQLEHPNIAKVFDLGLDGDVAYVVFEEVGGEPLDDLLARAAPLDNDSVRRIALEVAHGLAALHEAGVVHGGLTPASLLDTPGGVRIADLGVALLLGAFADRERPPALAGAAVYMAPEQLMSRRIDPRVDLYALGVVMYEALTGTLPFAGVAGRVATGKIKMEAPPVESRAPVDDALAELVNALLRRDPLRRPASAAAVAGRLEMMDLGGSGHIAPAIRPAGLRRTRSERTLHRVRRWAAALATGSVFTSLVAIGAVYSCRLATPDAMPSPQRVQAAIARLVGAPRLLREAGGLVIEVRTSLPARAQLAIRTTGGVVTLGGAAAEAAEHRFAIPADCMPVSARMHLKLERHGEAITELVPLEGDALRTFLEAALDWLAHAFVERARKPLEAARPYDLWVVAEYGDLQRGIARIISGLPPAWFLSEVGGPGGILDQPQIAPERKDLLYRTLVWAEYGDAAREIYKVPGSYPLVKLYGPNFGPSASAHYPLARAIPVQTPAAGSVKPFELVHVPLGAGGAVEFARRELAFLQLSGRVRVGGLRAGARSELHARLRLLPGRHVACLINGRYEVRFSRPGEDFPVRGTADVFVAFDPAYLREGDNEIVFRCPPMPRALSSVEARRGVEVDPPGFTLRFQSAPER